MREKVEDNAVILEYVSTLDMLADIMKKPIPATQFCVLRSKLGIQASPIVESSGSVGEEAARLDQDSVADKHLERLSCKQVAIEKKQGCASKCARLTGMYRLITDIAQ